MTTVDTEALRKRLHRWTGIIRPAVMGKVDYITPAEVLELIEEIERLRAELERDDEYDQEAEEQERVDQLLNDPDFQGWDDSDLPIR